MESLNFEFLKPKRPALAELGTFAEQYVRPDPASAVIKLRIFSEQVIRSLYDEFELALPEEDNLLDLLRNDQFSTAVPNAVLDRFHILRKAGNQGAHGGRCDSDTAKWALEQAHGIACWLHLACDGGTRKDCPGFRLPAEEATKTLEKERTLVLQRLAQKESEIGDLLEALESSRSRERATAKTAEELRALLNTGQRAVNELEFDEATTRKRMIDRQIYDAHWKIGPNGQSTDEVGQEVLIKHQPTETGDGFADYVLWGDDGKPLAVIEAKKTAESPDKGKTQAKCYADGLEEQYGQRPVVFYTNGHEIYLWDDANNAPPRLTYGFYSKDSLEYCIFKRREAQALESMGHDHRIVDRLYQVEALKRITERFTARQRKALMVQATGTGKTRVAVALSDILIRAKWAKRILFLCDRIELRRQAYNAFKMHLPSEPRTYVSARTSKDRDKRIYLATYPAMMKCFESFDVGFFDLIIADESHRSIYNRYRTLLVYFDALQVGLTATPTDMINRNTFRLFDCRPKDPTVCYTFEESVEEKYLVPFRVETFTTGLMRQGIRYADLTEEQREALEVEGIEPEEIDFDRRELDKAIFNKDTNRRILRNLMERGIREETGSHPGKSIIFARNHNHAVLLRQLFDEMYPQYGGKFCEIIDNYNPRAQQLIDDLKEPRNLLTIAISVDMLDTGIDIPEVVNLVFAKPVRSKVKFWQMIGRGTRLCPDLFGEGEDKTEFLIFDHWGNFEWFDEHYEKPAEKRQESLLETLFRARIRLAQFALDKMEPAVFEMAVDLLKDDIDALPERSLAIREKFRQVKTAAKLDVLKQFSEETVRVLENGIAPLMQWRPIGHNAAAYRFDLLIVWLQIARLTGGSNFDNLKSDLLNQVAGLRKNLSQVQAKADAIQRANSGPFWDGVTPHQLEDLRKEMRGIMQFQSKGSPPTTFDPRIIDIPEDEAQIEQAAYRPKSFDAVDMTAYRMRVERVLKGLFDSNPTLQKIKAGSRVTAKDLDELKKLVLVQDPMVDISLLEEFYPDTIGHLDLAIRRIIGLNPEFVEASFAEFTRDTTLTARQTQFLRLLKNHIQKYGAIELDLLYEPPFTSIDSDGIDGVFTDEKQIEHIIGILDRFQPPPPPDTRPSLRLERP